jgi:hypothetical protein
VCPSEYLIMLLADEFENSSASSHGITFSFRVPAPPKYRPYWLGDPATPFDLSPAVRFSLGEVPQPQLSGRSALSSSLAFLQSLAQHDLVRRPQPTNTSPGLLLPTAHKGSAVYSTRACRTRYVPSSGFGYPLDGLLPPSPCQPCFMLAALMGFTLRSVPLSEGFRQFPDWKDPHVVLPVGIPAARGSGPAQRAATPGL